MLLALLALGLILFCYGVVYLLALGMAPAPSMENWTPVWCAPIGAVLVLVTGGILLWRWRWDHEALVAAVLLLAAAAGWAWHRARK